MRHGLACALLLASAMSRLAVAYAQTDEIQVYDASIAAPGVFNLTWHNNYTPSGASTPRFPGGLVANHTLNGVPEWAYGVTDWFEAGLYLPLYSITSGGAVTFNGFKLRTLFVVPQADQRSFFYGINFEFSYNNAHWDTRRYTQEIRPIIGARFGAIDVIFNPILDNSYQGFSRLDFAPATRIAYNLSGSGRSPRRNTTTSDRCAPSTRAASSSTSFTAWSTIGANPGVSRPGPASA